MLSDHTSAAWSAGLDTLHARIAGRFRRSEAQSRVKRYLVGLLDRVERKMDGSWPSILVNRGHGGFNACSMGPIGMPMRSVTIFARRWWNIWARPMAC